MKYYEGTGDEYDGNRRDRINFYKSFFKKIFFKVFFVKKRNVSSSRMTFYAVEAFDKQNFKVTLFSAPHYCGEFDNSAAILIVYANLSCYFRVSWKHNF